MAQFFDGKVALVTRAASGLGRKIAGLFAREGAKVIVSDIDVAGGEQTSQVINARGGQSIFVKANIAVPEDCENLVKRAIETFGQLDFACNNTDTDGEQHLLTDHSLDGWRKFIFHNLSGVLYCMKYEIPVMLKSYGGSIVNVASILGKVGFAGAPVYVTSNHSLVGLTRSNALDYAPPRIHIHAVGPGFVHTSMIEALEADKNVYEKLNSLHSLGRFGELAEVAELIVWLCTQKASFASGSYYPIDRGHLAH